MPSDPVTIYCPNPLCQASNPESHRFCYQCRSPLPKRYLWAVGAGLTHLKPGELLADRYAFQQDQILLDTKPGVLPDLSDDVPAVVEPYLKLFALRLHVPQVYGLLAAREPIFLLEHAAIFPEGAGVTEGQLMPALTSLWQTSSSLRQLNWLWQIAHLWQPLSLQSVATTLLQLQLLRVEGGLVRLLELQLDAEKPPTLADLGLVWRSLQAGATPQLQPFLDQLCDQMQQGEVRNAEQLVAVLDQAIAACSEGQSYQIQIATRTDQGPSRQRNEDACYPPGGTVVAISNDDIKSIATGATAALVMVCDGIGGHEGGDVASNLAISTLYQKFSQLPATGQADPQTLSVNLEQATLLANDVISKRNDSEKRQERQRMGTTLVMSLVQTQQLYLTHVGDSRAYRVTRTGCHQVTLDDDLASREVRLGYATYREALQQPGSGSLIQALGMGPSSMLHPTIQRFVLDEDCLFLLCSDGLSDNDRVEQNWQTELLPILEGTIDLETASQRLVEIANRQNGHDNVTIGLVYCRVPSSSQTNPVEPLSAALASAPGLPDSFLASPRAPYPETLPKTQVLRRRRSSSSLLTLLTAALAALTAAAGLAYLLTPSLRQAVPLPSDSPTGSLGTASPTPTAPLAPSSALALSVGQVVQVSRLPLGETGQPDSLLLLSQAGGERVTPALRTADREIPLESVLQVVSLQTTPDRGNWLKVRVCSLPEGTFPAAQTVRSGEVGWVREELLTSLVAPSPDLDTTRLGQCTSPTNTN